MTSPQFDHGGTIFATARRLGVRPADILDFSASINPLGTPESVRRAVTDALEDIAHYPDNDCTLLVRALSAHHDMEASSICPGNGSTELIHLLPRLVAGRVAVVVAPPFSEYGRALSRFGWEIRYLHLSPAEGFALDPAKVAHAVADADLLIIANPGNPTGRLYSLPEMTELLRVAENAGVFVAVDEAFIDFVEHESVKRVVTANPRAVVLRSMTKFFAMAGLRAGYALGHPDVIRRLRELREPWSVGTMAQAAGAAALADESYILRTVAFIDAERRYLADALAAMPALTVFPSSVNYLLIRLDNGMNAGRLQELLEGERILIRNCSSFPGLDSSYFRVAVRTRIENDALLTALRRLAA